MTMIDTLQSQTVARQSLRHPEGGDLHATHVAGRAERGRPDGVVNPWLTIGGALGDSLAGMTPTLRSPDIGDTGRFAVHDVANALRAMVAAGEGTAAGDVEALLGRIDAGFADAERTLVAAGFDATEARELVAGFRERLADVLAAYARSADASVAAAAERAASQQSGDTPSPRPRSESAVATPATVEATIARFVRKTSFSLDVVTREGDTVSLRVRSRQAMSYGAAAAAWADASVTTAGVRIVSTSRLSVEVQGDLSEEELGAIRDLLAQAETIAEQFFGGDPEQAIAAGGGLRVDPSQLAEVALRMKVRERLDLRGVSGAAAAGPAPAATGPDSAAQVTAGLPAAPGSALPVTPQPEPAQPVAEPPSPATVTDAEQPPSAAQSLQSLLDSLSEWTQQPVSAGRLRITQHFKLQLIVALVDLGRGGQV